MTPDETYKVTCDAGCFAHPQVVYGAERDTFERIHRHGVTGPLGRRRPCAGTLTWTRQE